MSLRPTSVVLLVSLVAVGACGSSRFGSLHPGSYACAASVTSSTCGTVAAPGSMTEPIDGAGSDLISFSAPSGAFVSAPDPWNSVQFGAQADPDAYEVTSGDPDGGMLGCGGNYTEHAQLTTVGTDHVEMTLSYHYTRLTGCGFPGVTGDTCDLVYAMTCTRAP